MFENEK
jgi:hypothetical protein